jgi:hypothetical protein
VETKQERYSTALHIVSIMMPEVLVEGFIKYALILREVGRHVSRVAKFWFEVDRLSFSKKSDINNVKRCEKRFWNGGRGYSHGI